MRRAPTYVLHYPGADLAAINDAGNTSQFPHFATAATSIPLLFPVSGSLWRGRHPELAERLSEDASIPTRNLRVQLEHNVANAQATTRRAEGILCSDEPSPARADVNSHQRIEVFQTRGWPKRELINRAIRERRQTRQDSDAVNVKGGANKAR
jgi:hypothetical protein